MLRLPPPGAEKEADEETSKDELDGRRDATTAVPALEAVAGEELAAARPWKAKDVLEIRRGGGERAADGRIPGSAHGGEEDDLGDAGGDLEAAVGDVLVGHPIAREVEQQPERQRGELRADERATGRAGGDVEGDDQASTLERP